MNISDLFKYNTLISIPLFSFIALLLIRKHPQFSYKKSTISKSILIMKRPLYKVIFRLNFLLKALLDYGFIWYIMRQFSVPGVSVLGISLLLSVTCFGLLAFFIEGKHTFEHKIFTYSNGVFWAISQILLSHMTNNITFIILSYTISIAAITIAFRFLFTRKTNVYVQGFCISILYLWLIIFVFYYL